MARRRVFTAVALALLIAPVAWYSGSPWWTLWRMREAAREGDVARFTAWVDIAAINDAERTNHRLTWSSVLRSVGEETQNARDFRAYAERQLALADEAIQVPPRDMMTWLSGTPIRIGSLGASADTGSQQPYLVRYGFDRFEVRYEGARWDDGPLLTFRRQGLGWRLAGMRWGQQ